MPLSCREMKFVLPEIAEREGAPRVTLDAARHLAACPACAAELLRQREVNGLLDRLPTAEVPPTFTRRVLMALPRKAGTVAGLVLLAALVWGGALFWSGRTTSSLIQSFADPIAAAGSAIGALVSVVLDILGVIRTALDGWQSGPTLGVPPATIPPHLTALLVLAAAALAASGAALGRGVLGLWKERGAPISGRSRPRAD